MSDTEAQAIPAAEGESTVTLCSPIQRGDTSITSVTLRKPKVGDLRGLNLADLLQMKADTIAVLLPRISRPTLVKHEIDAMDPADFVTIAGEVVFFFASKEMKDQASQSE